MKYNSAQELINKEIDSSVRAKLYSAIINGNDVAQEILKSPIFAGSNITNNIRGRLINYVILHQFEQDILLNKLPFALDIIETNKFGYKNVMLKNDNIMINVARCAGQNNIFPSKAKFRSERCLLNNLEQNSLFWDFGNGQVKEGPIFVLLAYYTNNDKITRANIIVPDVSMSKPLALCNLMIEPQNRLMLLDNDNKEKQILKLKETVLKELKQTSVK